MNPVLAREGRERFRSRRAMPFLTLWVLGMGSVTYVVYLLAQTIAEGAFQLGPLVATGFMGRFMFQATTLLLVTAVVMVVPGVTALAIVGEKERQTLHLLQVTQLSPLRLVLGKLGASVSYLLWLVVAILPVVALPLLFGGTNVGDVAAALGMLVATALTLGAISIWVSARARTSRGAVAGSYAIAFVLAFFTLAMMVGEILLTAGDGGPFGPGGREVYSVIPNPYFGMVSAVDAPLELRQDLAQLFTPYAPFELVLFRRQAVRTSIEGFIQGIPPGAVDVVDGRQLIRMSRPALWIYTLVFDLVVTALALWRASRLVTAPAVRAFLPERRRRAAA